MLYDIHELYVYEVIKGVEVLLDESLDCQKCR